MRDQPFADPAPATLQQLPARLRQVGRQRNPYQHDLLRAITAQATLACASTKEPQHFFPFEGRAPRGAGAAEAGLPAVFRLREDALPPHGPIRRFPRTGRSYAMPASATGFFSVP